MLSDRIDLINKDQLSNLKVISTIVDGKLVYSSDQKLEGAN